MPCFGVGGENFWVIIIRGRRKRLIEFDFELEVFITLKIGNGAEKVTLTLRVVRRRLCDPYCCILHFKSL